MGRGRSVEQKYEIKKCLVPLSGRVGKNFQNNASADSFSILSAARLRDGH